MDPQREGLGGSALLYVRFNGFCLRRKRLLSIDFIKRIYPQVNTNYLITFNIFCENSMTAQINYFQCTLYFTKFTYFIDLIMSQLNSR